MTFGEVDRVSQFDHATQEIRPHAEALDNAGDLLSPRSGPPKVISRGGFPGGFAILNDLDFCEGLRDCRAICDFRNLLVAALIRRHGLHPFRKRQLLLVCEYVRTPVDRQSGQKHRNSKHRRPWSIRGTRISRGRVVRNNAKTLCVCLHSALEPFRSKRYCFQIIDSPLSLPIIAALQICGGSSSRAFYTDGSTRQGFARSVAIVEDKWEKHD